MVSLLLYILYFVIEYECMLPKQGSYDKRIFRLLYILNRLDSGQKVFSRQLAKDFNVSIRSIQRDISLLTVTGFLIHSPEKGVYTFAEGFSLKKIKLTDEEASLLTFLCEISQSLGDKFSDSFRSILKKVIQQEYDSPFYAKMPEGVKLDKKLPFMEELEDAIDSYQQVKISYTAYDNAVKIFQLDPLKIIYFDGFWYLLARLSGKERFLKFRLEKIKEFETLDSYFEPPKNVKTMLDQSVNIWFSEKRDKKVTLRVDRNVAGYFKQKIYFPIQKIKKENKDGSLIIETKTHRYEEIMHIIMHWIPYIKVISPKELIDLVRERINEYSKRI